MLDNLYLLVLLFVYKDIKEDFDMSDNMISDDSLSLDELELISGGVPKSHAAAEAQLTRVACPHCSSVCMVDLRKS